MLFRVRPWDSDFNIILNLEESHSTAEWGPYKYSIHNSPKADLHKEHLNIIKNSSYKRL